MRNRLARVTTIEKTFFKNLEENFFFFLPSERIQKGRYFDVAALMQAKTNKVSC